MVQIKAQWELTFQDELTRIYQISLFIRLVDQDRENLPIPVFAFWLADQALSHLLTVQKWAAFVPLPFDKPRAWSNL